MNTERNYNKKSYKSTPTGIRFNLEQEKIAFARSGKKTRQELVDFLLDNYVSIKIVEPTHVLVPKNEHITTSYTDKRIEKTFQQYMNEISELQFEDEYRKKRAEIESATNLTDKQKNLLYINMNSSKL